jgi:hypothetical protein
MPPQRQQQQQQQQQREAVEAAADAETYGDTQHYSEEDEADPRVMPDEEAAWHDVLDDMAPRMMWTHQPLETDAVGLKKVPKSGAQMADDNDDGANALEEAECCYGVTDTTFLLAADWDEHKRDAAESMSYSS